MTKPLKTSCRTVGNSAKIRNKFFQKTQTSTATFKCVHSNLHGCSRHLPEVVQKNQNYEDFFNVLYTKSLYILGGGGRGVRAILHERHQEKGSHRITVFHFIAPEA
jgi:hypothetical protein